MLVQTENLSHIRDITPEDLEELGFKVKFSHWRLTIESIFNLSDRLVNQEGLLKSRKDLDEQTKNMPDEEKRKYILPTGGKTICNIFDAETNEIVAIGRSVCHPFEDTYNKRRGRLKAFGKAMSTLSKKSLIFEKILEKIGARSIRPKLSPPKKLFSVKGIEKVIQEMQKDLARHNANINDIDTDCFVRELLEKLGD